MAQASASQEALLTSWPVAPYVELETAVLGCFFPVASQRLGGVLPSPPRGSGDGFVTAQKPSPNTTRTPRAAVSRAQFTCSHPIQVWAPRPPPVSGHLAVSFAGGRPGVFWDAASKACLGSHGNGVASHCMSSPPVWLLQAWLRTAAPHRPCPRLQLTGRAAQGVPPGPGSQERAAGSQLPSSPRVALCAPFRLVACLARA